MPIRAGRLRKRVTIQTRVEQFDEHGQESELWEDRAKWFAAIEGLSGTEQQVADQVQARITHRITMRYHKGLTAAMRLKHEDGRIFELRSVINRDEQNREHVCMAEEIAA